MVLFLVHVAISPAPSRYEIHPRFYGYLARGRWTSGQLHEVMRSNEDPMVRSTLAEMYRRHRDMIRRYRLFLKEVADNLHHKRPKRIKS